MIEILILYVIHKREKTLYGIRKEIIELFGAFTKPSIGTIYPALKRLLKDGAINVYDKMSEGGKKSSYFSITKKGFEYFRNCFFDSASDNPSLFHTQLQARLGTIGLLAIDDRKEFIKGVLKKIELYKIELERKLKDEFLGLDYFQEQLLKQSLNQLKLLNDYIINLKIDN